MLKIVLATAVAATLAAGSASAKSEAPPMDISWAIPSEAPIDRVQDAKAKACFARAYAILVNARRMGQSIDSTAIDSAAIALKTGACGGDVWRSSSEPIVNPSRDPLPLRNASDCARFQRDPYGNSYYAC
jgi:hypothetical protein